jgi:hypothetical protein
VNRRTSAALMERDASAALTALETIAILLRQMSSPILSRALMWVNGVVTRDRLCAGPLHSRTAGTSHLAGPDLCAKDSENRTRVTAILGDRAILLPICFRLNISHANLIQT